MRHRTIAGILGLALGTLAMLACVAAEPALAGGGIVARKVVGDLNGPAAFTFLPDGRIVYLERGSGDIRIYDRKTETDHRFYKVPGVNGEGERGALGVAVSPDWPVSRTLYVYVTRSSGGSLENQIVKVTRASGHGSMQVLMTSPASSSPYHNGGRILFGADGMLYAIVGDGHNSSNAQDLTGNLRGKILRMTPNGRVPSDNPIAGSRIYAFGIRNSYGFAFDPQTGRLWESENGPECLDEMNLIVAGGNFGWGPNEACGDVPGGTNNSGPALRHLPKLWFVSTIGITGAAFCLDCGLTEDAEGQLFFGGVNDGLLRRVALSAARDDVSGDPVQVLESPNDAIYSMETGPDGRIYFSDFQGIYRLAPA